MIKLAVSGCCGKMGQRIIALAGADKQFKLTAAIEDKNHPSTGKKLGEILNILKQEIIIGNAPELINKADVVIEFSTAQATSGHIDLMVKYRKAAVIGTTGFDEPQLNKIKEAGKVIPIVFSPNMSWGVNLVFRLVKETAKKLGPSYKISIAEAHHIHKKDAPSGTAKKIAELIHAVTAHKDAHIAIESIREDEIVGDHKICFEGTQDIITIEHRAKTRDIFAQGALEAAKFVVRQKPGLYDMQDVLNA
ncbi:MAG: 4-hydroxy-tetrahydrodipicolinate reductase [Candidatus Omnitrophota bacterium]